MYPPSALASHEHADVVLTLTVDTDGHVSAVAIAQSSGATDLDEAAVVAARQWTFTPATGDDKPVRSRIRVPFHFAPPAPPPEGVDTSKPNVLPAQPSVNNNRLVTTVDPAQPGANPICKKRIILIGGIDTTFFDGGTLTVTVDPRQWLQIALDFASLPSVTDVNCLLGDPSVPVDPSRDFGSARVCIPNTNYASGAGALAGSEFFTSILGGNSATYSLRFQVSDSQEQEHHDTQCSHSHDRDRPRRYRWRPRFRRRPRHRVLGQRRRQRGRLRRLGRLAGRLGRLGHPGPQGLAAGWRQLLDDRPVPGGSRARARSTSRSPASRTRSAATRFPRATG